MQRIGDTFYIEFSSPNSGKVIYCYGAQPKQSNQGHSAGTCSPSLVSSPRVALPTMAPLDGGLNNNRLSGRATPSSRPSASLSARGVCRSTHVVLFIYFK